MKAAGLLAGIVIFGATVASAQVGRPDLPDVGGGSNDFSDIGTVNGNVVGARASDVYVAGTGSGSHTFYAGVTFTVINAGADEIAVVRSEIDVPDRVKRKINRQVVNQKAFLPDIDILVQTEGGLQTSGGANGTLAGCKSRVRLDDFNPGRFRYETADAKTVCDQAALESLLVFPTARETAQRLLGTRGDGTGIRIEVLDLPNSTP